jgi:hypothetical protein
MLEISVVVVVVTVAVLWALIGVIKTRRGP